MYERQQASRSGKLNPVQYDRDQWYGLGHRLGAEHHALKPDGSWLWGVAALAGVTIVALLLTSAPPRPAQLAHPSRPACLDSETEHRAMQLHSGDKNDHHATCS